MLYFVLVAICAFIPVFSYKIRSAIVVSEFTSKPLVSEFSALSISSPTIIILDLENSNLPSLLSYGPNLVFDFSRSLLYRQKVKEFAIAHNIVFFSSEDYSSFYQKGTFYLHPPPSIEAHAIGNLLKYLEWSDYHVLSSPTQRSRAMSSLLSTSPLNSFSNEGDQEIFDRHIAKVVKSSGNWKTVAINEEPGASKVLRSFENNRIYKERCGLIVGSKGSTGKFKLGTIAVVEEGLEEAQTEEQYEVKAVLRAISLSENIASNLTSSIISNDILLRKLEEKTSKGIVSSRYSILNLKDEWKIIGDIEGERVRRWEEIVFPGNVTKMNNSPPKIPLSINSEYYNSDGTINPLTVTYTLALQPMVDLVNKDPDILSNFELEVYETDCSFELFEPECMEKHWDKIGLVQLAGTNATTIKLNLELFKQNNINIPHITLVYNDEPIYNKTLFPEVLSTSPPLVYVYSIFPYIIKSFSWNQSIVLFNPHTNPYFISIFLQNSESINLNILNNCEHMYIPHMKIENYNKEVKHILEFIHESKCKIVVLMVDVYSHLYFMEALYDFGYRKGDLVLIYLGTLSRVIDYPDSFLFDRKKVMEIADGSISLNIEEYTGEYGQELKKKLTPLLYPNSTDNTCYMLESLMLAVHSIDLMIQNGKDFEDFDQLMSFMRWIQFTGCSGRIAIDSAGNGRRDIDFSIFNFFTTGDKWDEQIAGLYSHGVMIPFKIDKTIVWANGITDVPGDTIYDPPCGFSPKLVKHNTQSWNLSIILTVLLFSFICVFCAIVWRCCFYFKRELLTEKKEMFFEDGVLVYLPVLEGLQFLGLGPSFRKANYYLALLCSFVIFDFDKVIDFEKDFWFIMIVGLGGCGLWCISLCITLNNKEEKLPRILRDLFHVIGYTFIQVFCQILFVSLNVLLLKIFDCKQGTGDERTDSFLKYDCRTNCWEGKHLAYVIIAYVVLFVYNLFSIVSRVISDDLMEYVSVNTQPSYATWKGIFQLIVVILNFLLKDDFEIVFAGVYCLLFIVWSVFVFMTDSTNYERLNGWIKVITASVCVHELLILGYIDLGIPDLAVRLLQVTILLFCLGIGFYVQFAKSSSMIYKRKARNFDKLLKFAFTWKMKAKDLTEHEIDYVNRPVEKYEIECN